MSLLFVGIGGALGALARAICVDFLAPRLPSSLPYHTLIVNIVACFAIGIVAHVVMNSTVQLMLCVGFLGGFSTLAAVCYEAVDFATAGNFKKSFGYLVLTYVVCLVSCAIGFAIAGLIV